MTLFVWIMITIVFLYTMGFSIKLWKESKVGSCAVALVAVAIVIAPFFTVL
ncbi:hypothetical protein [Virgibacillus necropolis]|uniref:hypothetical protein n=1 Tax=Virgibacillus necropolis TaxID=163877 RepID=UPI00137476AC|nr:hypothetical protein [Virgibacillus necropolis]